LFRCHRHRNDTEGCTFVDCIALAVSS
jgi:hypothetical protein